MYINIGRGFSYAQHSAIAYDYINFTCSKCAHAGGTVAYYIELYVFKIIAVKPIIFKTVYSYAVVRYPFTKCIRTCAAVSAQEVAICFNSF